MQVRRRDPLVCRWERDNLYIGIEGGKGWLRTSPDLMELLRQASEPIDVQKLSQQVGGDSAAEAENAVSKLLDIGILVADDEASVPATWHRWGPVTHRFHIESRDANYLIDSPERDRIVTEIVSDGQEPPPFKEYSNNPVVLLPRRPLPLRSSIDDVFAKRRTHRHFSDEEIDLDSLATVLFYSFAPLRFIDSGEFGVQQSRVSASAGARHEVECYVVAFAVDGLPCGLYHYSPRLHALELLDPTVGREQVAAAVYDQDPCFTGAFTCLTTAVADRLSWKYRHARAYRLWMYDAGHYAQTFSLTCTAMGLAPFQTIAFHDSTVESILGVNGDEEFAVYVLSAGPPDLNRAESPVDPAHPKPSLISTALGSHPVALDGSEGTGIERR